MGFLWIYLGYFSLFLTIVLKATFSPKFMIMLEVKVADVFWKASCC